MAFPTKTTATVNGSSSPVSVPIQSPASGDGVLVFVAGNRLNIPDEPSGWSTIDSRALDEANDVAYRALWKVCDGSEGANLSVTIGGTPSQVAGISYKFASGTFTGAPEAVSTGVAGTSGNPPALTPTFGSADTLWIAGIFKNSTVAPTGFPSDTDSAYAGTDVNATRMHTQHAEKTASSEDPPAFTLSVGVSIISFTAAIRGVSGGGGGGSSTPAFGRYGVRGPVR